MLCALYDCINEATTNMTWRDRHGDRSMNLCGEHVDSYMNIAGPHVTFRTIPTMGAPRARAARRSEKPLDIFTYHEVIFMVLEGSAHGGKRS